MKEGQCNGEVPGFLSRMQLHLLLREPGQIVSPLGSWFPHLQNEITTICVQG